MKALDGLREAIKVSGLPWAAGYSDGSGQSAITGAGGHAVAKVRWGCSCCEKNGDLDLAETRARTAIVLSVNLAPALVAVAEAAAEVERLSRVPGPEGDDLRRALSALRSSPHGGEGGGR